MIKFLIGLVKLHPDTPKARTFAVGAGGVLGGLAGLVNCYIQGDWQQGPMYGAWILGGLAAITGRDALNKIADKLK